MHRRLFEYLQSSSYNKVVGKMMPKLQCRLGLGAVVITLQRHLLTFIDGHRKEQLSTLLLGRNNSVDKKQKSTEEIKLLVNRFVGFGLAGLIAKLTKQGDDDEIHSRLGLARSMRIFHAQALMIPDYLETCYDKNQALKNNGYLALLSPRFFCFGVEMMKVIDREIHADIFKTSGGDCLLDAEKAILRNFLC